MKVDDSKSLRVPPSKVFFHLLLDKDAFCVEANPYFLDQLGYQQAELSAIPFTSLLDPKEKAAFKKLLDHCMRYPAEPGVLLLHLSTKKEAVLTVELELVAFTRKGEVAGVQGTGRLVATGRGEQVAGNSDDVPDFYRQMVEHSLQAMLLSTAGGKVLMANKAACALFGYSEAELRTKSGADLVESFSEEYLDDIRKRADAGYATGELIMRTSSGKIFPAEYYSSAFRIHGGYTFYVSTIKDLTGNRQAEDTLRTMQDELYLILNNTEESFVVFSRDLKIRSFNKVAARRYLSLTGVALVKGLSVKEMARSEVYEDALGFFESAFKGQAGELESRMWVEAEKRVRIFLSHYKPVYSITGQVEAVMVTAREITEKKLAEEKLVSSERRFKALLKNSSDGLIVLDAAGNMRELSISARKILGFDREMDFDQVSWDIVHPDDLAVAMKNFEALSKTPGMVQTYEVRLKPANSNAYKWIECTSHNLVHEPHVNGMIINFRDVTERKLATEALQQSEERWKFALEGSHHAIWDWNIKTGETFYSARWKHMLGYEEHELDNTIEEWQRRLHPDDVANVNIDIDTHFVATSPFYENVYRLRTRSGEYKWIQAKGMIVARDPAGKPLRMIGTHTDITQRVEMERALKKSEAKYKHLFYNNPQPMWVYDLETLCFMEVNEAAVRHYGYTGDEFRAMKINDIRPPGEVTGMLQSVEYIRRHADVLSTRKYWKHLKKDGTEILVEVKSHSIEYNGRKARLVLSIDVTEKVKAEEKLKESNQRFTLAARAASDAIWDADLLKNTIQWGEGFKNLFGYATQGVANDTTWIDHIHPGDKERVLERYYHTVHEMPDAVIWTDEYRFIRADESVAFVMDRGLIMRDKTGKPYRMIGAMQDVTERKKLEAELAQQRVDKQKQITEVTIQAQEKERSEIGKELHDNINQILTTTKLYIDMALAEPEIREELLEKCHRNVSRAIEEIRVLSKSLVPPSLGDIGLKEALADMIENLNLAGKINLKLKTVGISKYPLPDNLNLMVFRIVQEQLNNIIKHSRAKEAEIKLVISKKMLNICITDNGIGYDPKKKTKGIGLGNIFSRAELYNGRVEIVSAPGNGCTLLVMIPL